MKLRFAIHYRTEWGQQLAVAIRYSLNDGTERAARLPMQTDDGDRWHAETAVVDQRRTPVVSFTYAYTVEDAEGRLLRREWDANPRRFDADPTKTYTMNDQWADLPLAAHLYSKAYEATMQAAGATYAAQRLPLFRKTVLFRVAAPQLLHGQQLAVVGSHPALGGWNPARYLAMQPTGHHEWTLTLNADALLLPIEYKYVVVDADTHQLLQWEEGDNRVLEGDIADGEVRVLTGDALRLAEKPWRVAGVCVPVFSLRSEHSCGVGDFGDLYRFIDWAAAVGMKVVQLLPVNDTTLNHNWGDSDPYNITSAFRLHPHYIDLEQLGPLADKQQMTAFRRQQRELNALPHSDYEAVDRVKTAYLKAFYEQQPEHGEPFGQFVQNHLHRQLKRAADHARKLGIALMGDLPIGVSREGTDVAEHPELFHTNCQAGTPPDSDDRQGQNWGFPTYNWEAVEPGSGGMAEAAATRCGEWMASRLRWMEQYFDALRIDHVAGFFRMWEIPAGQLFATMGHFTPALPLTAGEIEYFGLPFRRDFLTTPFINDRVVDRLFGIHADYVRQTFLSPKSYGLYSLREHVATQQLIRSTFEGRTDENSLWIRDGLYRLAGNVLFLEDPRQGEMYHPRIQAWHEPVFEALSPEEKDAFMRIYNNFFYQRHGMFWGTKGYERLLQMLRSTRMLVCGEDLGLLPDCVAPVLDSLRILTMELQRAPKHAGVEFTHLDGNPVRSMATISTHDMAPLRLWWQESPERAQRFYTTMLQKQGRAPGQLPAHLAEEIIARHLYSPSMLCVLSLQDWLAMDGELRAKDPRQERINNPCDPFNRWQWRMHIGIEQLLKASRFNQKLKTMIVRSKR